MKRSTMSGGIMVLSVLLAGCGPQTAGIEREPVPTVQPMPDFLPFAAAACLGWINDLPEVLGEEVSLGDYALQACSDRVLAQAEAEGHWPDGSAFIVGQNVINALGGSMGINPDTDARAHDAANALARQIRAQTPNLSPTPTTVQ